MILRTARRPGVTLMEVLIAIGILAVGLLALMPLFLVGSVSMARSLNQNRAADHAAASDAAFRFNWKKTWIDVANGGGVRTPDQAYAFSGEPMLLWLDRPYSNPPAQTPTINASFSAQPSFVVLVDPVGSHTQTGSNANFVAGISSLTRTTMVPAETALPRSLVKATTLLDDMSWDLDGEPANYTGQLERGGRYNCAWLIQRPKNNIPHEVRLFVLVYAGRSPTDTPSQESAFTGQVSGYAGDVDPKPNTIVVSLMVNGQTQSMPNIRRGGWVGFSVPITPPGGVPYSTLDFYRVAAITDNSANAANPTITLELEQPLRSYQVPTATSPTNTISTFNGGTFTGTVIFFDNLYEVFDRGITSAQAISGR
jgi:prepilin-type N-terminal cleavage/methylation domain-containing protein